MTAPLTFLFFHYGKIPSYLLNAIEHVRIFNPNAEIWLTTEASKKHNPRLEACHVKLHTMDEFSSTEIETFRKSYVHISCFKEKFERFVLERWFVTEEIRKTDPKRIYVMLDSDVAVFEDASKLLQDLPTKPICLSSNNPHFTFIRGSISDFLSYILSIYADKEKIEERLKKHLANKSSSQIYNFGEMEFLYEYMSTQRDMVVMTTDTEFGYIDCNIHIPENFDYIQLKRRPRKSVYWRLEDGRLIPYFRKSETYKRAFILHFQGPGKRLFVRFNRFDSSRGNVFLFLINVLFSRKLKHD